MKIRFFLAVFAITVGLQMDHAFAKDGDVVEAIRKGNTLIVPKTGETYINAEDVLSTSSSRIRQPGINCKEVGATCAVDSDCGDHKCFMTCEGNPNNPKGSRICQTN